jgi:hypothetical protein
MFMPTPCTNIRAPPFLRTDGSSGDVSQSKASRLIPGSQTLHGRRTASAQTPQERRLCVDASTKRLGAQRKSSSPRRPSCSIVEYCSPNPDLRFQPLTTLQSYSIESFLNCTSSTELLKKATKSPPWLMSCSLDAPE